MSLVFFILNKFISTIVIYALNHVSNFEFLYFSFHLDKLRVELIVGENKCRSGCNTKWSIHQTKLENEMRSNDKMVEKTVMILVYKMMRSLVIFLFLLICCLNQPILADLPHVGFTNFRYYMICSSQCLWKMQK